MEDVQIVELYWQRDPEAIRETDCKYGCYCRTVAWNILTDIQDVEECVKDTWMGAWNAMPVQRPVYLAAFLGRITRNLAFNRFKSSRAEKRGGGEPAFGSGGVGGMCSHFPQRRPGGRGRGTGTDGKLLPPHIIFQRL